MAHHRPGGGDFRRLEQRLGYHFKDRLRLTEALTASASNGGGYQRLEYFGDGVLRYVVPKLIETRYPGLEPGELTRRYSLLTRNINLAFIATRLKLFPLIRFGSRTPAFDPKLLADVVEAIFGAIDSESGTGAAMETARKLFRLDIETSQFARPDEILVRAVAKDRRKLSFCHLPRYWDDVYHCGYITSVEVDGELIVPNGEGLTVDAAQNRAAAVALFRLFPSVYPTKISNFSWKY